MPCTTLLVGKKASNNGATIMARNEDGQFDPKHCIVVMPDEQPRQYVNASGKLKVELPDNPMRYTAMPNGIRDDGIWGACGINEKNIAMTATETITSNPRVMGADPLVETGLGEEDLVTLVLPYINSAKEGVYRTAKLLEEFGTYEMNGMGFQDDQEIWWLETIGGHHFIAKRVPDEVYVVMPNQQGIDYFDLADAFGPKENHICSEDLLEFIRDNNLDVSIDSEGTKLEDCTEFDVRGAFGSRTDADHEYNTPRAWFMERYFNPSIDWDTEMAVYTPESDFIPWCMVPERKITSEDVKYVLSSYYQGTPYDPFGHEAAKGGKRYRPIGVNRTNFMGITELCQKDDPRIKGIEWVAMGCNAFNAMFPVFTNVEKMPQYISNISDKVDTNNFYWHNRLIAVYVDNNYSDALIHVERYQRAVANKSHEIINETKKALSKPEAAGLCGAELHRFLEEQNQKICDFVQKETDKLLSTVLLIASEHMKLNFTRADG